MIQGLTHAPHISGKPQTLIRPQESASRGAWLWRPRAVSAEVDTASRARQVERGAMGPSSGRWIKVDAPPPPPPPPEPTDRLRHVNLLSSKLFHRAEAWSPDNLVPWPGRSDAHQRVDAHPASPPIIICPGFGNCTADYAAPFGREEDGIEAALRVRVVTLATADHLLKLHIDITRQRLISGAANVLAMPSDAVVTHR